ncbi:serine hydrolase domain-containing protein [Ancylobacter dichloromethanicus]
MDADTVFQLASLSKAVAGTVVAHEVGARTVSWETPVIQHLPWFRLKDQWVSEHATIADLMSHRSGLPDHGGDILEDIGFDRRAVLERLRLLPLEPFRISYAYTNFGFTAGAEAVAVAAGKDWATLSEDVLYTPLGMTSTSSRFADFDKRANKAVNHVRVNGSFVHKYQREPDAQSPAGGVELVGKRHGPLDGHGAAGWHL